MRVNRRSMRQKVPQRDQIYFFDAHKAYTCALSKNNEETFMAALPEHAKVVVIGQGGIVGASALTT